MEKLQYKTISFKLYCLHEDSCAHYLINLLKKKINESIVGRRLDIPDLNQHPDISSIKIALFD